VPGSGDLRSADRTPRALSAASRGLIQAEGGDDLYAIAAPRSATLADLTLEPRMSFAFEPSCATGDHADQIGIDHCRPHHPRLRHPPRRRQPPTHHGLHRRTRQRRRRTPRTRHRPRHTGAHRLAAHIQTSIVIGPCGDTGRVPPATISFPSALRTRGARHLSGEVPMRRVGRRDGPIRLSGGRVSP